MRTWADDLRRLCDALGQRQPVVLGSSFGGNVVLTYAGLFPDHPAAVILANTNGGRTEQQRVIEAFGRLGEPAMGYGLTGQVVPAYLVVRARSAAISRARDGSSAPTLTAKSRYA